ncbi:4'-phosphopantetheinyl transferase superfamily protein [Luteolibacter flavescens]|uniref:4'-phosphopantetheinyl transferase superfamily protein n=1 Tax=Luteolibacter flavescens TaxID=1859460 RepID=A0ABT3FN46_9BACT|nr:4'-phosphopantetheinyl transferase superfamily protein [Luteolibacter flavescens]MCW1884996.1 4'-phosphopantetheinyl transferase superfamily protein [Luteolibacter flavescens]
MPLSPPALGTALVIVVDPVRVGVEATACLSASERTQAERFHFEKDAIHWRACRAALRGVLGEALGIAPGAVGIDHGEHGKPELSPAGSGLHFNLSHCRDLALIALCQDGAVGVDIEPADRAPTLLGCEDAFCHPGEISLLPDEAGPRATMLMDLWTRKEALLKALGTGMSLAPQSVSVADPPASYADDARFRDLRLHALRGAALERHVACLAAPASVSRILLKDWPGTG